MAFVIPSIYTAVDRYTAPVRRMISATNQFIGVSETGIQRQERLFKKFTPVLSETTKQMLDMAKAAAIAGGILATVRFTGDQLMQYENNLASFRTIVSDLTDNQFEAYRKKIFEVGNDTKTSSVVVAQAFEKVAGLNSKFAETATGIGQVSQAAIVLSKASKDELGASAENLVGIMNQFSYGADQANRTINVLAAGQAVGAASITETAQTLQVFGAVAKSSNATLEQTVSLIEVLASKQIKGSEAGTALRGVFVRLQKAGLGYKSGQFQINDALEAAKNHVAALRSAKEKDAYITKLFGMENLTAGKILLDNIPKIKEWTDAVTGTSEAQKAATINSNTLSAKIEELKAKWVNLVTGSDEAAASLDNVKGGISFVTNNMETLLLWGSRILIFFAAWKALIYAARIALMIYNIQQGISAFLQEKSAMSLRRNIVALTAYAVATRVVAIATKIWSGIQAVFNAIMSANPIAIVILAIAALVAAIIWVVNNTEGWGKQWDATMSWIKAVFKAAYLELKIGFQIINIAFWDMVNAVVAAWYWAQNKLGFLSDEQYKKNMSQIAAEKAAKVSALKEYVTEYQKTMAKVQAGPGWHVKKKDKGPALTDNGLSVAPALMPTTVVQQSYMMQQQPQQKVPIELTVRDQTGGKVAVTDNPKKVPVVSKTFSNPR